MIRRNMIAGRIATVFIFALSMLQAASAKDITVTGTVSDESGALVMNAKVSFFLNTTEYRVLTGTDGSYSVKITGSYSDVAGQFRQASPIPIPSATRQYPIYYQHCG